MTETLASVATEPDAPMLSGDDSPGGTESAERSIYRLRDLDRAAKWVAGIFALALLLAPILAFVHFLPDWMPSQDPALMGIRALDVGTERTPVIGQPSLSGDYVPDHRVNHLGPIHFYMLAPAIRLLGPNVGMLLVSVLIVGTSLLVVAWATFRQLGPRGGLVAAAALAAITYTTGAATLVNPVSSNIAGYPLLCSMVLLWCLLCGDIRLLPLAAVFLSFTAQQHLSVLPTVGLASIAVGVVIAGRSLRSRPWRDPAARRQLLRWGRISAVVAGLLWLPVLVQQFFASPPNLTALVQYSTHDDRPSLGYGVAVRQVAHVLGWPPILGQRNLSGSWLFHRVSLVTWLTTGMVVVAGGILGWRWRRTQPRRAGLVLMAGVLAICGLFSGASVPVGKEQTRLAFYHWAPAAQFFLVTSLGLAAVAAIDRLALARRPQLRAAAVGVLLAAIIGTSIVSTTIHRWPNTLLAAYSPYERSVLDQVTDQVMDHRSEFDDGEVVLIARGEAWHVGIHEALAFEMNLRGVAPKHPRYDGIFVAGERLVDRDTVEAGLVMVLDTADGSRTNTREKALPPDGAELIADVAIPKDSDPGYEYILRSRGTRIRVYLLDRDELLDWGIRRELGD